MIEDDIVDREQAGRTLDETGLCYSLVEADNATEALARADLLEFDCVLMDYRLPEGNSLDLFEHILQQPCTRRPPVVILTGAGTEDLAVEAMKRGAQDYVSKANLDADSLRQAIQTALDRSDIEGRVEERTKELERLSYYDSLTELPNRTLFHERFEQVVHLSNRNATSFAILVIDLNKFKTINDTYGHEAGDEVLKVVSSRLRAASRDTDTFARFGGDEFAAILPTTSNSQGAKIFVNRIMALIEEPIPFGEHSLSVGASIGVAFFPEHAMTADDLLACGDEAMYRAKRYGMPCAIFESTSAYTGGDQETFGDSPVRALEKGELLIHYQPQLDLENGEVIAAEAFVRWRHPTLGLLPPTEFLPAIESDDALKALTLDVASQVAAQAKAWSDRGWPLGVSLHYPTRLLDDGDLPAELVTRIISAGTPTDRVTIEVAERGLMAAPYEAGRVLRTLAQSGVRLSLDGFGIGFSSLRYLNRLDVREIKIDRSFVNAIADRREMAIIRSIVALGHAMELRVVAAGIENVQVLEEIQAAGCSHGQGNHFCRPVEPEKLDAWLEDRFAGAVVEEPVPDVRVMTA